MHNVPAADRALESFVAPARPEWLRAGTSFWLGNSRGEAGARLLELSQRAARLVGPAEDAKLKALTGHLKKLIADGYHPIVFCRYIPTAEYLAQQLDGKLGKKTIEPKADGNWALKPLPEGVNVTFVTSPAAAGKLPEGLKAVPVGDGGEGFVRYRLRG